MGKIINYLLPKGLWSLRMGVCHCHIVLVSIWPCQHFTWPHSTFGPYWAVFTGRHSASRHSGTHH